jgi:hypothetical protein
MSDRHSANRALRAVAAYDALRLGAYRDRESAPVKLRVERPDGAWLLRYDDVAYFNRVYAPNDSIAGCLHEVETFYRDSPFGCELLAAPAGNGRIREACSQRGWLPGRGYAWMHMETALASTENRYPGISIRPVGVEERMVFLDLYLRGFGAPTANFPAAIRNMRHLFDLPQLHFLVASRKGKPAAIGMLCVFGETALLSAGATPPEQRRHGCHHALLAARFRLARDLGCRHIVSHAIAGGQSHRNMESLGLRTVNVAQSWRLQGTVPC